MAKKYIGTLSLEWYNKQKSMLLISERNEINTSDVKAPKINWVNQDEALFYEIIDDEGKGLTPYWVNKNDIRVKEARPLIFKSSFKAIKSNSAGTIPGLSNEWIVQESNEDDDDSIENILIKGDNLLVLNALKKHFENKPDNEKVKCIYIDPPYNTGSAFEHYDDNLEHSEWLTLMRDRLDILQQLLSVEGYLVAQIDDKEFAYLFLLLADIFGRENVKTICVKMSEPTGVKMAHVISNGILPKLKEYLIICRKEGVKHLQIDKIPKDSWDNEYKTIITNISQDDILKIKAVRDNEERTADDVLFVDSKLENAQFLSLFKYGELHNIEINDEFKYKNAWRIVQIVSMTGAAKNLADLKKYECPNSTSFSICTKQNKMYLIRSDYDPAVNIPRIKLLFADDYLVVHPGDFWADIKTTGLDNEGNVDMKKSKKPEKLIHRILSMCTYEDDLVLDIFGGSGTTFSVAHKMKRRWIGCEIGNHMDNLIVPRMIGVLKNRDQSPIIEETKWRGGGSFKYYHLGPSIINQSKDGTGDFNWSLGKKFIEESLLLSYDYILDTSLLSNKSKLFSAMEEMPAIGVQKIGTKCRVAIVSLNEPEGKLGIMPYEEIQGIYKLIKAKYSPEFVNIFTNRGVEIAFDSKPDDLEIIKVPHAIFAELEK